MESAHKDNNTKNRTYTNTANWTKKEQAKQSRATLKRTHEVKEHVNSSPFKRVYSDVTTQHQEARQHAQHSNYMINVHRGVHDAALRKINSTPLNLHSS
jgi:hypothetical protein